MIGQINLVNSRTFKYFLDTCYVVAQSNEFQVAFLGKRFKVLIIIMTISIIIIIKDNNNNNKRQKIKIRFFVDNYC